MNRSHARCVAMTMLCCAAALLAACSSPGNNSEDDTSSAGANNSSAAPDTVSAAALPTSCDTLKAVVDRDLGTTTAKVEIDPTIGASSTDIGCLFDATTGPASGYAYISFSQDQPGEFVDFTTDRGWKALKLAFPGTATDLSGIGDKAYYVTNEGSFGGINVVSHKVWISLGSFGLDTEPPLEKWESLAKDIVATLS